MLHLFHNDMRKKVLQRLKLSCIYLFANIRKNYQIIHIHSIWNSLQSLHLIPNLKGIKEKRLFSQNKSLPYQVPVEQMLFKSQYNTDLSCRTGFGNLATVPFCTGYIPAIMYRSVFSVPDPHWFWSAGSGSKRAKMPPKIRKKGKKFQVLKC